MFFGDGAVWWTSACIDHIGGYPGNDDATGCRLIFLGEEQVHVTDGRHR